MKMEDRKLGGSGSAISARAERSEPRCSVKVSAVSAAWFTTLTLSPQRKLMPGPARIPGILFPLRPEGRAGGRDATPLTPQTHRRHAKANGCLGLAL